MQILTKTISNSFLFCFIHLSWQIEDVKDKWFLVSSNNISQVWVWLKVHVHYASFCSSFKLLSAWILFSIQKSAYFLHNFQVYIWKLHVSISYTYESTVNLYSITVVQWNYIHLSDELHERKTWLRRWVEKNILEIWSNLVEILMLRTEWDALDGSEKREASGLK